MFVQPPGCCAHPLPGSSSVSPFFASISGYRSVCTGPHHTDAAHIAPRFNFIITGCRQSQRYAHQFTHAGIAKPDPPHARHVAQGRPGGRHDSQPQPCAIPGSGRSSLFRSRYAVGQVYSPTKWYYKCNTLDRKLLRHTLNIEVRCTFSKQ